MNVKMLVVQGRPAGKSLSFPRGEYYFGRGTECHIRPNSDWVSRQHCLLRVTSEGAYLRDLGSRNGTLVNGVLLECERLLTHGDQIQIGPLVFEVEYEDAPTPAHAGVPTVPAPLPADPTSSHAVPSEPNAEDTTSAADITLAQPPPLDPSSVETAGHNYPAEDEVS